MKVADKKLRTNSAIDDLDALPNEEEGVPVSDSTVLWKNRGLFWKRLMDLVTMRATLRAEIDDIIPDEYRI
jgi:hypothetical protein